jgi:hypothetical protein
MFCIKDNNKSHIIKDITNLEDLYDKIKEKLKIPKYLQRLEYNGKNLNEQIFNEIKIQELVNLNLFLRFNILDFTIFVDQVILNKEDIKKQPILINKQYYDSIYCISPLVCEQNYIEVIFRQINYNNKDIFLNINDDTKIYWRCDTNIEKLNFISEKNNNQLSKIRIILNENLRGNGCIYITDVGINTDEEIKKKLKFKLIIRNGLCLRCAKSICNQYILVTNNGYCHKECIGK